MSQTALAPVATGHPDLTMLYQASLGATLTTSEGIVITAKQAGAGGQDITVEIVAPGAPNAPLSTSVIGNQIVVSLATDVSGTRTSTAAQIVAALNAHPNIFRLVTASTVSGSALVGAMSQTALAPVTFEAGSYAGFYETVFSNSATHPQNALIPHLGGLSIPAGATFLYVKDARSGARVLRVRPSGAFVCLERSRRPEAGGLLGAERIDHEHQDLRHSDRGA